MGGEALRDWAERDAPGTSGKKGVPWIGWASWCLLGCRSAPRCSILGVSRRGCEFGRAMKRRGRNEVTRALRDGRAVADPHLASLAAALAKEQMRRSDYRGPPRRQEVLTLVVGGAAVALFAAFARHESGVVPAFVGGCALVVVWVVGLRRLVPSHRQSTDRLLTAYRTNVLLAEKAGPGAFERVRVGTP
jgi:hypothetical protein